MPDVEGGAFADREDSGAGIAVASNDVTAPLVPNTNSASDEKKQAGKTVAAVLGEIVWLMTQSREYRDLKLLDLERLIMPALLLKQFKITYVGGQPSSLEIWAFMTSPRNLTCEEIRRSDLRIEWRSGTEKVVVVSIDRLAQTSLPIP